MIIAYPEGTDDSDKTEALFDPEFIFSEPE